MQSVPLSRRLWAALFIMAFWVSILAISALPAGAAGASKMRPERPRRVDTYPLMEPAGMNAIFRHFVHSKRRTRLSRGSVIKMMNFIGAAQAAQVGGRGLFPPVGGVSGSFMLLSNPGDDRAN